MILEVQITDPKTGSSRKMKFSHSPVRIGRNQLNDLSLGDRVEAAYETRGSKKIVIQLDHRRPGLDGSLDPLNSIQSGD